MRTEKEIRDKLDFLNSLDKPEELPISVYVFPDRALIQKGRRAQIKTLEWVLNTKGEQTT